MINYDKKYNRPQLEKWYLEDRLSLTAIGKKLGGLSRQSVANRIRRSFQAVRCEPDQAVRDQKTSPCFSDMLVRLQRDIRDAVVTVQQG